MVNKRKNAAKKMIASTPRTVRRPKTEHETKAFAENIKALQMQRSQRYEPGHVTTPHYHRTPASPFVITPDPDPTLLALKDEVKSLR
jgi:hypothetical protein